MGADATTHWIDLDAARRAARAWHDWADQLHRSQLDLDASTRALQLEGVVDGAPLRTAAIELHTIAAFVRTHTAAVDRADTLRRSSDGDVVGPDGIDPVRRLDALDGDELVAYWATLDHDEIDRLVRDRPDLIALHAIAEGARLTTEQLRALRRSNAYSIASDEFVVEFDATISGRFLRVDLGRELSVLTNHLSNGTVELTVIDGRHVGAGVGVRRATATLGFGGEVVQRLHLADEQQAAAAIRHLRRAVERDLSLSELARDGLGAGWNHTIEPVNTAARVANWLIPGGDPIPSAPTYDLTTETSRALRRLWDEHGMAVTRSAGLIARLDGDLDLGLVAVDAELDGQLFFYETQAGPAADDDPPVRIGAVWTGSVTARAIGLPGDLTGGGGRLDVEYIADLHRSADGDRELTVTMAGGLGSGPALGWLGLPGLELEHIVADGARWSVEMTVPVDAATAAATREIATALAGGSVPAGELESIHDRAEIALTLERSTGTTSRVGVDGGVVAASATVREAAAVTTAALHKYPGGRWFSRDDVDRAIDAASRIDRTHEARPRTPGRAKPDRRDDARVSRAGRR